jgi:tRNA-splicing ligase RtcB
MMRTAQEAPALQAHRVGDTLYEIAADPKRGMRVPARIYADEVLWEQISSDRSIDQLVNVATLPGVTRAVYAMPDAHEGYGFPVGGVGAFRTSDGVVSPGGVGYDINCGVRLLACNLSASELGDDLEPVVHEMSRSIPSGAGRGGRLELNDDELDRVFVEGCGYLRERGLAVTDDLLHAESGGCLPGADPAAVSQRARNRGRDQLGTMGSGNHFVEVERVSEIFDPHAASALGLETDQIAVLVHTGSRTRCAPTTSRAWTERWPTTASSYRIAS